MHSLSFSISLFYSGTSSTFWSSSSSTSSFYYNHVHHRLQLFFFFLGCHKHIFYGPTKQRSKEFTLSVSCCYNSKYTTWSIFTWIVSSSKCLTCMVMDWICGRCGRIKKHHVKEIRNNNRNEICSSLWSEFQFPTWLLVFPIIFLFQERKKISSCDSQKYISLIWNTLQWFQWFLFLHSPRKETECFVISSSSRVINISSEFKWLKVWIRLH